MLRPWRSISQHLTLGKQHIQVMNQGIRAASSILSHTWVIVLPILSHMVAD
jgi:hypothetical protein